MANPVTEDAATLANVIGGLGGVVIPGPVFRFQLPLAKVKEVVPKINQLGIGVRKVGEFEADNPTKLFSTMSVVTLELYRPDQTPRRLTELFGD
jgi:hypothetical protein